jgi:hypothetical protein
MSMGFLEIRESIGVYGVCILGILPWFASYDSLHVLSGSFSQLLFGAIASPTIMS